MTLSKLTYSSSELSEIIEYLDVIEDLSSNIQHEWPWIQNTYMIF